jgi:hypothetical protein
VIAGGREKVFFFEFFPENFQIEFETFFLHLQPFTSSNLFILFSNDQKKEMTGDEWERC